jgi:hypothetical protein
MKKQVATILLSSLTIGYSVCINISKASAFSYSLQMIQKLTTETMVPSLPTPEAHFNQNSKQYEC